MEEIKLNAAHKVTGKIVVIENTPEVVAAFEADGYIIVGFAL